MTRYPLLWMLLALMVGPVAWGQTPANQGTPVLFNGRRLFTIHSRLGTYEPFERARVVVDRLQRLAEDRAVRTDAVVTVGQPTRTIVQAGPTVIATVTEEDARAEGRPRQRLAEDYAAVIRKAIADYREERSARSLLLGGIRAAVATILLIAALYLTGMATLRARQRITALRGRHAGSDRKGLLGALMTDQTADTLSDLVGLARLCVTVLLLGLYVPIACGALPWTRGVSERLQGYIEQNIATIGAAFLSHLPDLLFVTLIALIAGIALRILHLFFLGVARGAIPFAGLDAETAPPTYRLVRLLVLALAAVAAFPYVPGSRSPAFQGISVFIGALLTLGSTAVVSNMVAGVVMIYMRPFRVGDRVKVAETVGDVIARTDLVTRIRTSKNEEVTIPNALLLSTHIVNYSAMARETGLILHTSVTIGYDVPWRKVHGLLIDAARASAGILPSPSPFVLQTALNDYHIGYEINAYTDQPQRMAGIYSELHQNIQDQFSQAGVEILSPGYVALRDGNPTTVPAPEVVVRSSAPRGSE